MKRFVAFLIVMIFCLMLPVLAIADMGAPSIESYYVFVGPDGLKAKYYDPETETDKITTLQFGQKVNVYDRYEDEYGSVQWVMVVENKDKSQTWFTVTDSDFKNTLPDGKDFPTEKAVKSANIIGGKVIGQPGLNMRLGPATGFDSKGLIPFDTEITYEYTYDNWGYVTYEGKTGWINLDYIKTDGNSGTQTITDTVDSTEQEPDADAEDTTVGADIFATKSGKMLIMCLLGGLILALTALVIIILIIVSGKKSREKAKPADDSTTPPFDKN